MRPASPSLPTCQFLQIKINYTSPCESVEQEQEVLLNLFAEDKEEEEEDRMSQVADDILISIISKLPLQEALATSILSTRWRYLHTYITHFNFNFPPCDFEPPGSDKVAKERFSRYVRMIDATLDSRNRDNRIKEFNLNINYCINSASASASIDKWLLFAFTGQAHIIQINMIPLLPSFTLHNWYLFPYPVAQNLIETDMSALSGEAATTTTYFNLLRLDHDHNQKNYLISGLKELCLSMINVTDQDFALLVSNFLGLETLSIQHTKELKNVSIVGHPKLKHLCISNVWRLESFEIRDVINLISLECYDLKGGCGALQLINIPNLTKFMTSDCAYYFGISYAEVYARIPSSIRHQLHLLHLSTYLHRKPPIIPRVLPYEFPNTKHLELEVVNLRETAHFIILNPLLNACPSLQKLKIKLLWDPRCTEAPSLMGGRRIVPRSRRFPVTLKELEITGYLIGRSQSQSVLKLASYIIRSAAASLEQLIVVTCDSSHTNRVHARRDFQSITPPSLNLQII